MSKNKAEVYILEVPDLPSSPPVGFHATLDIMSSKQSLNNSLRNPSSIRRKIINWLNQTTLL